MQTKPHRWILLITGLGLAAIASAQTAGPGAWQGGYFGLHSGSAPFQIDCSTVAFTCDRGGMRVYAGAWRGQPFGVDVSRLQVARPGAPVQGLKVSVFAQPGQDSALHVYGRVATSMAKVNTSVMGAGPELGAGLSYGVGVGWALSPQASVRLGWDVYDVRLTGAERDPVRAMSLGLHWRY